MKRATGAKALSFAPLLQGFCSPIDHFRPKK